MKPEDPSRWFVEEVGRLLGLQGSIQEQGVSRVLHVTVESRQVRVGTNKSYFWIEAPIDWLLPQDAVLFHAPANTYKRAKLLEGSDDLNVTGDDAFDSAYLVMGKGPNVKDFARSINGTVRAALLAAVDLHPDVKWMSTSWDRFMHLHACPSVSLDPHSIDRAPLGIEPFTPGKAAAATRRTVQLAACIERSRT